MSSSKTRSKDLYSSLRVALPSLVFTPSMRVCGRLALDARSSPVGLGALALPAMATLCTAPRRRYEVIASSSDSALLKLGTSIRRYLPAALAPAVSNWALGLALALLDPPLSLPP